MNNETSSAPTTFQAARILAPIALVLLAIAIFVYVGYNK